MKTKNGILFRKNVCVAEDRPEHVAKHGIGLPIEAIAKLADRVTQGKEGIHVFHELTGTTTLVIRGTCENEGKQHGIFRTMWRGNAGKNPERTGLSVKHHSDDTYCKHIGTLPYAQGFCPFCD